MTCFGLGACQDQDVLLQDNIGSIQSLLLALEPFEQGAGVSCSKCIITKRVDRAAVYSLQYTAIRGHAVNKLFGIIITLVLAFVNCKIMPGLTHMIARKHTMVRMLACIKLPHELGKVPAMLLLLTTSTANCRSVRKLCKHC